ncbi:MAG: hypothetical protein J0653_00015, partial [Deltaproteobacteria bacterium]|nr:hypothetical protein [Deltaproteobacteria bacterium]
MAVEAAVGLLRSDGATERMVVEALMILVTLAPEELPEVEDIIYLRDADVHSIVRLMDKFGISSREADYNCRIALYAVRRSSTEIDVETASAIELALIAGGEFNEALRLLGMTSEPSDLINLSVEDAFNRVMVLWGRDG